MEIISSALMKLASTACLNGDNVTQVDMPSRMRSVRHRLSCRIAGTLTATYERKNIATL